MDSKTAYIDTIGMIVTLVIVIPFAILLNFDNDYNNQIDDLKSQIEIKEYSIESRDNIINHLYNEIDRLNLENKELKQEILNWRKTALDIINQLNSWYSNNPIIIEKIVHHSSSNSSSDEDESETNVCELTSDECGEDEYLDASGCRCISRKPPVQEPNNNLN